MIDPPVIGPLRTVPTEPYAEPAPIARPGLPRLSTSTVWERLPTVVCCSIVSNSRVLDPTSQGLRWEGTPGELLRITDA